MCWYGFSFSNCGNKQREGKRKGKKKLKIKNKTFEHLYHVCHFEIRSCKICEQTNGNTNTNIQKKYCVCRWLCSNFECARCNYGTKTTIPSMVGQVFNDNVK